MLSVKANNDSILVLMSSSVCCNNSVVIDNALAIASAARSEREAISSEVQEIVFLFFTAWVSPKGSGSICGMLK